MEDKSLETVAKLKMYFKEREGVEYSDQVIRQGLVPSHRGTIEKPQGYAEISRSCGDGIIFFLQIHQDKIMRARFFSMGCLAAVASGNAAAVMAEGKDVYEAFDVDAPAIADALGGLPEKEDHCAELACEALREALRDYLTHRREPWKRDYPKKK
ncbi:MAG: iron-sulfur cluster assembly scaffold protein [Syntrophobacterales bacterium]|jgi:nitrogen fixation NifU-like protein|nr:iron-sulfur cluster assembly scaffold protein [Syntrophobacterales bacterium]